MPCEHAFRRRWAVRLTLLAALAAPLMAARGESLLACGSEQVRLYEFTGNEAKLAWRWSAHEEHGLPAAYRTGLLEHIDECKPVMGGTAILLTASTGGVALIDRQSGRALFWAQVAMAHSAALLPGERIVVAASLSPQGNRLELYDRARPEQVIFASPLHSGHGVVWDGARSLLFSLGFDAIRAYRLADWEGEHPRLVLGATWPLPGQADGHDLSALPDGSALLVSTADSVWRFNPDDGSYRSFEPLAGRKSIKAVSVHPATGRIAYQQPEERWWAHHIGLIGAANAVATPGMRLYKVRWLADPPDAVAGDGASKR